MLIDKLRVAENKFEEKCIRSWIGKSEPYWIKLAPARPLEGLEVEYAKLAGKEDWDAWDTALGGLLKGSKRDRRAFLVKWLEDVRHAAHAASGEPEVPSIYLPVWR